MRQIKARGLVMATVERVQDLAWEVNWFMDRMSRDPNNMTEVFSDLLDAMWQNNFRPHIMLGEDGNYEFARLEDYHKLLEVTHNNPDNVPFPALILRMKRDYKGELFCDDEYFDIVKFYGGKLVKFEFDGIIGPLNIASSEVYQSRFRVLDKIGMGGYALGYYFDGDVMCGDCATNFANMHDSDKDNTAQITAIELLDIDHCEVCVHCNWTMHHDYRCNDGDGDELHTEGYCDVED